MSRMVFYYTDLQNVLEIIHTAPSMIAEGDKTMCKCSQMALFHR